MTSFDKVESEILTASLNKPKVHKEVQDKRKAKTAILAEDSQPLTRPAQWIYNRLRN
jgi:hypothetical protein